MNQFNRALWRNAAFALVVGLAASIVCSAQSLTISGTVRDANGVVPGSSVTLRAPGGGTTKAVTDEQGQYKFEGLIAGPYEVSVAREGYLTATRSLSLSTEPRTLDVTLAVGGVATSIDVVDVAGKTTGSRMEIADREIPSHISTITQQTIQEQGLNDLATALENASGVVTQLQYGVYEWYTIGGFTQQSGNDFLFVDGMTLTGNRSNTQLNNVEEIQVLKGPNAVLYGGAGAGQGGMVNVIRKKPQALRTQDVLYRFGPWGLQQASAGTAGQVFGLQRVLYRVDASFSNNDGWRASGAKRFNVTPDLTWLINNRMRVAFIESFSRDRYTLDAGVPVAVLAIPDFPLDRKLNPPGDFQLSRDWQNQVIFTANITNRLELRNSFFKRRNRDQYLDAETLGYVPATNAVNRTYLYFQHNRRPLQNQTDFIGDYKVLGLRHRFMAGYDYEDQFNFTNRTGNAPNTSNSNNIPIPALAIADFLKPGFVDPAVNYTSFPRTRVDYSANAVNAGYWQDQVDVTKRLRINIAGRYDDYKRRTHNDVYNNDVFVRVGPDAGQRHQTNYSYRAGAVYSLAQRHSVYFSSASTFHPVFTIPADGKELEPTRSRSYEIGHKFQGLGGRLVAYTSARRIFNTNLLIPLGGNLFDQAGQASSKVLDFDLNGDLGRGVRATANYGYSDARYDEFLSNAGANLARNRLANAQKHAAKMWVTKQWKMGETSTFTTSLGARYVSKYYTNSANTVLIPSRFTMNAAAGLRRPSWDATVNLENLTGKERYFVSQINGGNQLYPGPPFHAFVTIRYRFN